MKYAGIGLIGLVFLVAATGSFLWLNRAYTLPAGLAPERGWLRQGYTAYTAGEYADAEVAFRRALAANPARSDAYEPLAHTLYQQQRFTEAQAVYQKALSVASSARQASLWLAAGNAELQLGHLPAAAHAYRQSLLRQPGYISAQQNLSWVLLKISEKNKKTPVIRNRQSAQKKPDTPQQTEDKKQKNSDPEQSSDAQANDQNSEAANQIRNEQQLSQAEMNQLLKQLDNAEKQLRGRPTKAKTETKEKAEVKDW